MPQLSFLQKTLSWIIPVRVRRGSSDQHKLLELFRYRGRWQLATEDALYSDGAAYSPLRLAFSGISAGLAGVEAVLVLGAGLGSAVWALEARGYRPHVTLVDWDEVSLGWAAEILSDDGHSDHVEAVLEDAARFVVVDENKYNVIIVDLFRGRQVPAFALQAFFLRQCIDCLEPNGYLILNFIESEKGGSVAVKSVLESLFGTVTVIRNGINRIFTAQLPRR